MTENTFELHLMKLFREWCINYNVVDLINGFALFEDPTLDSDSLEGADIEIIKKIKEFFKEFSECFVVQ